MEEQEEKTDEQPSATTPESSLMTQADSTDLIWIREKEGKYFHLMAAKSIELVLQLILEQHRQ